MSSYWHPQWKWQLVEWFVEQGILTHNKAQRMSKRQLYGKYKETRERGEKNAEECMC
jgi:hypothetical protein